MRQNSNYRNYQFYCRQDQKIVDLATSVEQCSCPPGYKGLSCEDCAPGYTRSSEGLYLGLCQPCQCFGHASLCHAETGVCLVNSFQNLLYFSYFYLSICNHYSQFNKLIGLPRTHNGKLLRSVRRRFHWKRNFWRLCCIL